MAAPGREPILLRIMLYVCIVLSHSQNGCSKDFFRYDCAPGGFLVVIVIAVV